MIEIKDVYDFLGKQIQVGDPIVLATAYQGRSLFKTTVVKIRWYGGNIVIITDRNDRVRPSEVIVIKEIL